MIGDEAGEKWVNFSFRAAEHLTPSALRAVFRGIHNLHEHHKEKKLHAPGGKNMDKLSKLSNKENSKIQCMEVGENEFSGFKKYAKKYGLRFTLLREINDPTHYVFSFPQKDVDKFESAARDFLLDGKVHGDLDERIHAAVEKAVEINRARTTEKVKEKTHQRDKGEPSV